MIFNSQGVLNGYDCAPRGGRPSASGAEHLFEQACRHGHWARFGAALLGHSRRLLDLHVVEAGGHLAGRHDAGIQAVPLCQIHGTEDRTDETFDVDFYPLQDRDEPRWVGVAAAWQTGGLPPVELIQVGQTYYVRDGHHRVSIARALGMREIDAHVIVWDLR